MGVRLGRDVGKHVSMAVLRGVKRVRQAKSFLAGLMTDSPSPSSFERDPLTRSLESWSSDDLDSLVGRREGQTLEAKGPEIDISSRSDRKTLARALAAFVSAQGGTLLVGASESDHVVTDLPGVVADDEGIRRLEMAMRDLIQPLTVLSCASFARDGERRLIVIQVDADPAGRPAMVVGRGFVLRVGDESVELPYQEVERRLSQLDFVLNRTKRRAAEAIEEAQSRSPRNDRSPLAMSILPLSQTLDLGLTGHRLTSVWWEVVRDVETALKSVDRVWARHSNALPGPQATGHGLVVAADGALFEMDHEGTCVLSIALESLKGTGIDEFPSPYVIAEKITLWMGASLSLLRAVGVGGSVLARVASGGTQGLSHSTIDGLSSTTADGRFAVDMRRGAITAEAVVPIWGDTASTARQVVELFAGRLRDSVKGPTFPDLKVPDEGRLLAELLPRWPSSDSRAHSG